MFTRQWRRGRALGWIGLPFFAFFLLWASTVQAAENAECWQCHNNPRLSKGAKDGSLLSLYVNEEAFKASAHGAAGMGCTDCHQEAQPKFHPAEGFTETGCTSCHADQGEAYKKTTHGLILDSGLKPAPKCQDCHTSHYIRKINDPQSPVQTFRLSAVCAKCHEEARPPQGFFAALATYRLMGHRKVSLADRYDAQSCANCHPENVGHPQKPGPPTSCVKCHDQSLPTPLLLGPIHFKMSFADQPVPFLLRFLYGAGIVILVVGGIAFLSYRLVLKRKAPKGEEDKTGEST